MKYLTITVPCYNSQDYMERCIQSLLEGGNDVEIIIVDDGSTDRTPDIADYYEKKYPEIVRVVHKENGGHGSGVNKGLELATGKYFKVVDSDDWLDRDAYLMLLKQLKRLCRQKDSTKHPDLLVCNYIYDHYNEGTCKQVHYRNVFPAGKLCNWNHMGHFRMSQYLIMHALIFRTEVLIQSGIRLPEHTFYVDNLFANQPLANVKTICYLDLDLYHYFLGREDQSVNAKVLMKRIDQQILVTKLVTKCSDLRQIKKEYPKLEKYLCRNISIMLAISSIHLLLMQTKEARGKRKKLWEEIKEYDHALYYRLKYSTVSGFTYLPGRVGDCLTLFGYKVAKKWLLFQ